ncbi:MAG: hypothetical protein COB02_03625 [Candidatus Cloacimonadota bacterium]|nr:MAG: hypothetical protein COB02_03625 [Candidatus Cloacimonadota bacterium]
MKLDKKGFLLVDMMIAVSILFLMVVIVSPSFTLISDYRYKQFIYHLEKVIKTCKNLSILRQRTIVLHLENSKIYMKQQINKKNNYYFFENISKSPLKIPSFVQLKISLLEGEIHQQKGNNLFFYPGGRFDKAKIEMLVNGKEKNFEILLSDSLKEVKE